MSIHRAAFLTVLTLFAGVASSAYAQAPAEVLTPLQLAAACAIPPAVAGPRPAHEPRVVGAQDTGFKTLTAQGDLLVVNSGLKDGLELNQRFFVRRPVTLGAKVAGSLHAVSTVAWVRIIAVNDIMAIANVDHSCNAIQQDDYLEPYVEPRLPDGADKTDATGDLDFTYSGLGRVLFGDQDQRTGVVGDFMLVDRGTDRGMAAGARYAVYRDAVMQRDGFHSVRPPGLPLAAIGEAIVVSASPAFSVVRITGARDTVQQGDYLVPRKP